MVLSLDTVFADDVQGITRAKVIDFLQQGQRRGKGVVA